ncbi:hypothetical protein L873DRAFT_1818968, partial [Choiromyces venosus 120613-1]
NARGLSTACLLPDKQQKSSLRINSDTIEAFPRCSESNFSALRADKGFVYFDRTRYLSTLDSIRVRAILFLRPRRFGKSLTLSMLEHFHADLDVDKDVKENKVTPGQYLILKFNFAEVRRTRDLNKAAEELALNIIRSLKRFYGDYYPYLGGSLGQMISENINQRSAIDSLANLVELVDRTLWEVKNGGDKKHPLANVKGIYLLADEYDAFSNEYMDPHNSQAWAGSAASSLVKGFWATVKGMAVLTGEDFNIASPPNSEVSERFLGICASSPRAVTHIQNALTHSPDRTTQYHLIPYSKLVHKIPSCGSPE